MERAEGTARRVAVVDGAGEGAGRIVDAVDGDADVVTVESVDDAVTAVRDGTVDCVVCRTPAAYERVREADPSVVVIVVADALARDVLDRIVGDVHADYVQPDEMLADALPARLDSLVDLSASAAAWQLADFADEAVVEFDLETYALLEANEQFYDAWEWEPAYLADATLADLRELDITQDRRGRGRGQAGEEQLAWMDESDPVESLVERALGGRYEVREWHCVTASGDPFKTEVRVVADEANRRGYLVASVPEDDGPDRALAYDESAMLRSLLEHVPMAVYFKDERSRHVLVSEDVVEPFIESPEGKIMHTPADVHMKTEFDLYPTEHAEEAVADNEQVMETGKPIRDRIERVQPPGGRELFFSTTKAPWYDSDGRIRGIVGVTRDITDRKHRDMALDRQREHVDTVAGRIDADLVAALDAAADWVDAGSDAAAAVDRARDLAASIEAYTRAGAPVEDPEWLAGDDEARAAWDDRDTAGATLDQDWAYTVQADRERLVDLFGHLFENALEHAGPDVTVTVGTLADESGFYVADDGPGVPAALRDEAFEPGTASGDGPGYGLAAVRQIARAHGWTVRLAERDDGGARVEVTGVPRGE